MQNNSGCKNAKHVRTKIVLDSLSVATSLLPASIWSMESIFNKPWYNVRKTLCAIEEEKNAPCKTNLTSCDMTGEM